MTWTLHGTEPTEEVILLYWPSPKPNGSYALGWKLPDGTLTWPGSRDDVLPSYWHRLEPPAFLDGTEEGR